MQLSTTSNPKRPLANTVRIVLFIIGAVLVYAYAVQALQIDLAKPLEPGRQSSLMRVLRMLADPDVFAFSEAGTIVGLSAASVTTLERIVETIFMALIASFIGTILAVPISFLAARNLMEDVTAPLAAIMAGIALLPVGGWLGGLLTGGVLGVTASLGGSVWMALAGMVGAAGAAWLLLRTGPDIVEMDNASPTARLLMWVRFGGVAVLGMGSVGMLAQVGISAGGWLETVLGPFGFLGNFLIVLADLIQLALPAFVAFIVGLIAYSLGTRYGQEAVLRMDAAPARILTGVLAVVGVGVLVYAVGGALNWLYQFDNPANWTTKPALIGGGVAGLLSLLAAPKRPYPIGLTIYTISRSILNILRSIEPLIMGIVFVVWVGLGPFAGVMALALHSIAALGKLFSEQVESIAEGPIEAITATGAGRLQVIVFAVIPQIVPLYTAFTLYRWDINVRMSTIIGFVGGGGIGDVLSQNIQKGYFRQASVMMIAIAIVVSLLDYVSAKIRARIV